MPFGLTESLIGVGGSILGGLFNKPKPVVTDTTPTFTAAQQGVQGAAGSLLQSQLANPTDYVTAQKNAAIGQTNNAFNGAQDATTAALTARGFGKSGKVGTNIQKTQLARAGAISNLSGTYDALQQQYSNNLLSQAMQFGFADPGSHSVQSGGQPNPIGSAINNGLSTATFMYGLNHFMNGGSGPTTSTVGTDYSGDYGGSGDYSGDYGGGN